MEFITSCPFNQVTPGSSKILIASFQQFPRHDSAWGPLGGLTTSKPGVVGSVGRVYSAETTLRLKADIALLTLRSDPSKTLIDVAIDEYAGSLVTLGMISDLGVTL